MLQDFGFVWIKRADCVEILARRLYAIEMAMEQKSWAIAATVEKNAQMHSTTVQDVQHRRNKYFRAAEKALEKSHELSSKKKKDGSAGEFELV